MNNIKLDLSHSGVDWDSVLAYQQKVDACHREIFDFESAISNGWIKSPEIWLERSSALIEAAIAIKGHSKAVVVIGIGGSYLGAAALISALKGFGDDSTEIYYTGNNLSSVSFARTIENIKDKDFSVIVISKSGGTIEPALAFRVFWNILRDRYGEEANQRVYAITDPENGLLRKIANEKGFTTFPAEANIGGRYSVLSPVGLLPMSVAGLDITQILQGAADTAKLFSESNIESNLPYQYAVVRNILYQEGKHIEILGNYEPKLSKIGDWWKQLFAESEGKEEKGIFVSTADFTTDLHSLGQYIQEGPRHLFETLINIETTNYFEIPDSDLGDGLDYLAHKSLGFINQKAFEGTLAAHSEAGIPNIIFNISELNPYNIGALLYIFELSCAMSAKILGVNPFDQPGVEKYKANMLQLLNN